MPSGFWRHSIKFSIIVPTYNRLNDLLIPCLDSIRATTKFGDVEVLVMANGCTDGTEDYVRSLGEPFRVLSHPKPLGYTKAMNTAVCAAEGEFVVPFNNDVRIIDWGPNYDWLAVMNAPFSDPKVGITGPFRQYRAGNPFIVFCLAMIRKELFWKIGMLDEAFNPGAGEDTDWCMKLAKAGYKVVQVPDEGDSRLRTGAFPMYHMGGGTVSTIREWSQTATRNEKILQERYGFGTENRGMNRFLKTRSEIDECSAQLRKHGMIGHRLPCKDWDLCAVLPYVGDGNFLDMGSTDSYVLQAVAKMGRKGFKYGIDRRAPDVAPPPGIEYFKGDLLDPPFEDGTFQYVSCLSVVEHGIDFDAFARECRRLMAPEGRLFVTFDYWEPRTQAPTVIGGLPWSILDKGDAMRLIEACKKEGLVLDQPVDWETKDPVVNPGYFSPTGDSYTFGVIMFVKRE